MAKRDFVNYRTNNSLDNLTVKNILPVVKENTSKYTVPVKIFIYLDLKKTMHIFIQNMLNIKKYLSHEYICVVIFMTRSAIREKRIEQNGCFGSLIEQNGGFCSLIEQNGCFGSVILCS